jgi:hypothetical protein
MTAANTRQLSTRLISRRGATANHLSPATRVGGTSSQLKHGLSPAPISSSTLKSPSTDSALGTV